MEPSMKIALNAAVYRRFCVVAAVAIFFTNFANYSERWGFIPLYWVGVLGALSAPLLIGAALHSHFVLRPLMIWCAGYLLITIAWYFPSKQDAVAYQEVQTRVLSVIFLLLILFLCARPDEQRLARVMVALAVLLAAGLNIYELFNPLTFSKIPGRSSGLFENSNQSGAGLMLGMILAYGVVPPRLRIPFIALTGVGILTTFTRSAMLGWIIIVLFFAARGRFGVRQLRGVLICSGLVVAFIFSPYWGQLQTSLEERGSLNLSVLQRLAFFSSGAATDESANDRMLVAEAAWRLFERKPYTGYGTGSARNIEGFEIGTHDIYLANMVDHGITGLFIVPALLLTMLWGANRKTFDVVGPFVLFLTMWGLFTHNLLEERYILLAVALVASMVASAHTRGVASPVEARVLMPAGAVAIP
jgi:hypothetical protein